MNGFKKNKNGTTKRTIRTDSTNEKICENPSQECKTEYCLSEGNTKKVNK